MCCVPSSIVPVVQQSQLSAFQYLQLIVRYQQEQWQNCQQIVVEVVIVDGVVVVPGGAVLVVMPRDKQAAPHT